MTEHNNGMFVVSDNLAKDLNVCYVPKVILNCDDEQIRLRNIVTSSLTHQAVF